MKIGELWKRKEAQLKKLLEFVDEHHGIANGDEEAFEKYRKGFVERHSGNVKIIDIYTIEDGSELVAFEFTVSRDGVSEINTTIREDFVREYERVYE